MSQVKAKPEPKMRAVTRAEFFNSIPTDMCHFKRFEDDISAVYLDSQLIGVRAGSDYWLMAWDMKKATL